VTRYLKQTDAGGCLPTAILNTALSFGIKVSKKKDFYDIATILQTVTEKEAKLSHKPLGTLFYKRGPYPSDWNPYLSKYKIKITTAPLASVKEIDYFLNKGCRLIVGYFFDTGLWKQGAHVGTILGHHEKNYICNNLTGAVALEVICPQQLQTILNTRFEARYKLKKLFTVLPPLWCVQRI
jgi:hypothetical protein